MVRVCRGLSSGRHSHSPLPVRRRRRRPGQKDLSFLTVDYGAPGAPSFSVKWGWDDTATSGNNTRDACALFDTDSDGLANYSYCLIVATDGTTSEVLYSCGDGATDKCTNPRAPIPSPGTSGTTSIVTNSDPFGVPSSPYFTATHLDGNDEANPGCNTNDTVAETTIALADVGGSDAFLLNVCSYPSQLPGSDPSDCIFTPNVGFLTIVKAANPNNGTAFTFNASAAATTDDSSWTINGSGQQQFITYSPTTTLDLNEVVPAGWKLDSASCQLQTGTPTSTGTPTATGVDNFTIQSGVETICTFNDSPAIKSLSIVKTASPTTYDSVGDVISYQIVATNTGNVTLSNVTVSDPTLGTLTCTPTQPATLAPGAAITCSGSHTITQADLDAGTFANTACATRDGATEVCDTETVTGEKKPALSLVKTASPTTYDSVGDVITYHDRCDEHGQRDVEQRDGHSIRRWGR